MEQALFERVQLPEPVFCPDCRQQQRLAYRNERVLYRRACGLCEKPIVTIFSGDQPFPVYCSDCWFGDTWDALSYERDFDFSRSFFEQFFELQSTVPRLTLFNVKQENSEYCNMALGNKNSYLVFASDENEDSMYGHWIQRCTDTYNSSNLADCTLCFDLIDSEDCYSCVFSQDLKNCSDCCFSYDLIGCQNCFLCSGLRNKQYYIENAPCTKEEYQQRFSEKNIGGFTHYAELKDRFLEVRRQAKHKCMHLSNTENCKGDYIVNSKNCINCYDVYDGEDCIYAHNLVHKHYNNVDVSYVTETRNSHQITAAQGEELYFSMYIWSSSNIWYSSLIQQSRDIFGCVGLRYKNHCLFNKEYRADEYDKLRARLVTHMKETQEWGKFFPTERSLFAYNETVAQDYYPLGKEYVIGLGFRWQDSNPKEYGPATCDIPNDISEVPDSITKEILSCDTCNKNYRVIDRELRIYRQMKYPIPHLCPDCRYLARLVMRNGRRLWNRKCDGCGSEVESSYSPEGPEKIYCQECYQRALY